MRHLTAPELAAQLAASATPPLLLDVREPHEFAYCRIAGSINLPLNSLPARLAEINPSREIIVICHHGIRSHMAAQFLLDQGYANVVNLTGGVASWAEQVEPEMPRY